MIHALETPTRLASSARFFDYPVVQEVLPFSDNIFGTAFEAEICFTSVELGQAGEVAFEAKPKGFLGHRSEEPNHPTNISLNPVMLALVL